MTTDHIASSLRMVVQNRRLPSSDMKAIDVTFDVLPKSLRKIFKFGRYACAIRRERRHCGVYKLMLSSAVLQ